MNSTPFLRALRLGVVGAIVLGGLAALLVSPASGDDAVPVPAEVKRFDSPDAAAQALVAAAKSWDKAVFVEMFGAAAIEHLRTGDEGADKDAREAFLLKASQGVKTKAVDEKHAEVLVGADEWPFPIPLVKDDRGWAYDAMAGAEEILRRRIGENEILTIATLREYVRAQVEYASRDRDEDEVREYAQRVVSSEGKRDGLWWPAADESDESPLGEFAAAAGDYMEGKRPPGTWHGYYFRILTKQGANAPGGKYDYVINGNMIAGFAMIAFPAEYRKSGVLTFIVSHTGKVFEKDLGAETEKAAAAITEYDPDESWDLVVGDGTQD